MVLKSLKKKGKMATSLDIVLSVEKIMWISQSVFLKIFCRCANVPGESDILVVLAPCIAGILNPRTVFKISNITSLAQRENFIHIRKTNLLQFFRVQPRGSWTSFLGSVWTPMPMEFQSMNT